MRLGRYFYVRICKIIFIYSARHRHLSNRHRHQVQHIYELKKRNMWKKLLYQLSNRKEKKLKWQGKI
jgi:hypothetical protein